MKPLVAIVGRPNVGKSLLFNRIIGQRLSIVEDTPGVTRDRLYAPCEWNGVDFDVVDTGGIEPRTDDEILLFIREQAQIAIDTADVIVFVTELGTGVTAADMDVAGILQRSRKPVVLVANKVDGPAVEADAAVLWSLDPTLAVVRKGLALANAFQPDVILALGGGSPMDAAKIMWVMYEAPEVAFEDLALRFMDIRKRIYTFPKLGVKAQFVAVPTTSGTGSEVTPFAVVTDERTGIKYPIADYELTPSLAIVDANLVMDMPKGLTAAGGIDAVTHALEAYVSVVANEYTDGQALQALKLLKENLPSAYRNGAKDPKARELVHNAATMAGIASS